MSRSGYSDDIDDPLALGRWRAQVASSMRGKRGQALLRDLIAALDALPERKLIAHTVEQDGCFCALGAVAHLRGTDLDQGPNGGTDYDFMADRAAARLNIAEQLAQEVVYMNDEASLWNETPESRWARMRQWAVSNLIEQQARPAGEVRNG
ncbi:hypothetical protein ACI6Q5_05270 [Xanthomonas codiaei]|uniref:Uncharacterized protein n=1 Tax=Xanthomonas codiaei TaxID=56463 RepID=A0A2S7CGW6_9XANT|nr:hypothetical protein [Xanthomonas codiaei]PPU60823.1 hypothetical protein XcodCFBP4690_17230 [Xanthomonas codiaei]